MYSPPSHAQRVGTPVSSVSEFVLQLRELIEHNCPLGWVRGEVSNLVRASSGHLYFTLKDERAQIRCTMWRNRAQLLAFQLTEGMQVEVRAQASIYEARGDLQLSVENIRRAGLGNLYEAFLRLKSSLEAEGLFAATRKRPVPVLPRGLGIVTSPSGAALHDVLSTLQRRAPGLPVVIYPSQVQGDAAGALIAAAIGEASRRAQEDGCELLIVCRGGGSIEDLWAFNQEAVVRAIAACRIPVISGVGHETDTTLADYAADQRAATPTAAAEMASAGLYQLRQRLPELKQALKRSGQRRLQVNAQKLDELQRRLTHPRARIAGNHERVIALERRLQHAWQTLELRQKVRLEHLATRLRNRLPRCAPLQARLDAASHDLSRSMRWRQSRMQQHLDTLAARLEALNPDAVLARGYAIVRSETGEILRDADAAAHDAELEIQFAHSRLKVRSLP